MQRPAPAARHDLDLGGSRRPEGPLGQYQDVAVQAVVDGGDPVEHRLDELDRRDLPGADQPARLGDGKGVERAHRTGALFLRHGVAAS